MLLQFRQLAAIGLLVSSSAVWVPSTACAYEDQLGLALATGYAHDRSVLHSPDGPSLGALLDYGLDDIWTLRARLDYSLHPETFRARRTHVYRAQAEAVYAIDILAIVPYFGAGLGAQWRQAETKPRVLLGAHLVLGLDFLLTRRVNLALDLRSGLFTNAINFTQLSLILRFLLSD